MSTTVCRKRHDPLFSDWRISHFHLGTELNRRGFYTRTKHTAFAYIDGQTFRLLAVWPHEPRPYENIRLLKILKRDWPHVMEQYRAKGVDNLFPVLQNPEHIQQMRRGFLMMYDLDGVAYHPPGGGVVSSGDSAEAVMKHNRMANLTTQLQHEWARQMGSRPARFRLLSPTTYAIQDREGRFWELQQTWYHSRFVPLDPQIGRILEGRFNGS
ncbi:hypothetical protein V3W47_14060 [Deinococcus sp. YIM 134068]|uniref:hypothetical protein n=1 Tax=Deinococcus lichenicola TaxID=3118910 RepID=UPI002F93BD01